MKAFLAGGLVAGLLIGSTAARLAAAPFDPNVVGASAKWYSHLDADAARKSPVISRVHEHILSHKHVSEGLAKMRDQFGFDHSRDLHSVTHYGSTLEPHQGVLVIKADADRERVKKQLKERPDFKLVEYGDDDILTWKEGARAAKEGQPERAGHTAVVGFAQKGVFVAGHSLDAVKAGLDVVNGKSAALSPLAADAPVGAIVQAKAAGLTGAKLPLRTPILQQVDHFSMAFGDTDGDMFMQARVGATSAEAAGQMQSVVEGIKALAQLRMADSEELKEMVDELQVAASGSTLDLAWHAGDEEVLKGLAKAKEIGEKMMAARKKARDEQRERGGKK